MSSNELIVFTDEQKKIIKSQFFPQTATNDEMVYCMNIAKVMGLNPITKEIFFVPRRSQVNGQWIEKVEPMLGRDSYIKVAHSTGKFAGMETTSSIERVPNLTPDGGWEESSDLVATCKVWRTDTSIPFTVSVRYSEYVQKTKQGEPTKFWKEKPDTMLKKVAESQALRKAFSINGAYSEDEIETAIIEPRSSVVPQQQDDPMAIEAPSQTESPQPQQHQDTKVSGLSKYE